MSDYHPESWNPSWSVETLLVGLQSFMYEDSNAIGSITTSTHHRASLAKHSLAFNMQDPRYVEMFAMHTHESTNASGGSTGRESNAEEEDMSSVCRFCMSPDGELISPCMCRGSNEWVHVTCLRQWQTNVLLTQSTHPKYQTSIDRICNVCLEPFTGKGIPTSRHEQIMNYLGGSDLSNAVSPGNLLVSTRSSSRENLELMQQHPQIKDQLQTWTKAVFLMIQANKNGLLAVSTSLPVALPPLKGTGLRKKDQQKWVARNQALLKDKAGWYIQHYDGGPMERDEPMAVVHVSSAVTKKIAQQHGVLFVPPYFVYGLYENVANVLKETGNRQHSGGGGSGGGGSGGSGGGGEHNLTKVAVIWGCGGWGGTQVLAEIARGGWGLVNIDMYVDERPDASLPTDFQLDFDWSRMVSLAKVAPKSDYNKK